MNLKNNLKIKKIYNKITKLKIFKIIIINIMKFNNYKVQ